MLYTPYYTYWLTYPWFPILPHPSQCIDNYFPLYQKPRAIPHFVAHSPNASHHPVHAVMTMMLQSIILFIGISVNGRDVYSVVGAGSFAINGFYFPVISAPYKYAMESDYPHGKQ